MRPLIARFVAALTIGSMFVTGLGTVAVGAAPAAVDPVRVAGSYLLYFAWSGRGYTPVAIRLHKDGTGGLPPDHVTWSTAGRTITVVLTRLRPTVTATFVGKVNKTGLSSIRQPGTMSNTDGSSGTWYAIKTPS